MGKIDSRHCTWSCYLLHLNYYSDTLFLLSMLSLLVCYFIFKVSISNAGDRLKSFFIIVGAIFAYKAMFKMEYSGIQETVMERKKPLTEGAKNAKWRSMSDKGKS